ncbi:MAG: SGNH/GDSL hydrolase family protein [Chloroflexota bacterium]|nr:SGNH/GDSL hydrolase family protein [Chloroflexota bacterium]
MVRRSSALAVGLLGLIAVGFVLVGGWRPGMPPANAGVRPLTYVALGASDSVGVGAAAPERESWVAVLHSRLPAGSRLVNLGVSGSLLHQALEQQLPVALAADPDLVTVWLAVNDLNARVPLDRYAADLDTLLRTLRERTDAVILVGNVPDLSALPAAARMNLAPIPRWNAAIEAVVARNGAQLVDLSDAWSELAEHPEYVSADGFHPSTAGYVRLADRFQAAAAERIAAR